MVSWGQKDPKLVALTWKKSWKVVHKIRGSRQQKEAEKVATNYFFPEVRPHIINGFLGTEGPQIGGFDLEKFLESCPQNLGSRQQKEAEKKEATNLFFFL